MALVRYYLLALSLYFLVASIVIVISPATFSSAWGIDAKGVQEGNFPQI
jgi:hypothetical protein